MRAVMLALLMASVARAAAPPSNQLSDEQRTLLRSLSKINNDAIRLWDDGKRAEALRLRQDGLRITRRVLGDSHKSTISWMRGVASFSSELGRHKEAAALLRDEARAWERLLGPGHQKAVDALWDARDEEKPLSDEQRKKWDEASRLVRRADSAYGWARYAQAQGDYEKALPLVRQARGEKHPRYASVLHSLAVVALYRGDFRRALSLARQTVKLRKVMLGERHPDYAVSLNDLAHVLFRLGEFQESTALFEEALRIREAVLGGRHPQYISGLNNLAALRMATGDFHVAQALFRRALRLTREVQGENNIDYAQSLNNLGAAYYGLGDYDQAALMIQKAVALRKKLLPRTHPSYANGLNNLARVYIEKGEHKAALPLLEEALKCQKDNLGEGHPNYAGTLNQLAIVRQELGEPGKALALSRQAVQLARKALGEKHPEYANYLNVQAYLYSRRGEPEQARPLYQRVLALTIADGPFHPSRAAYLNNLARANAEMERPGTALRLIEQCLALSRRQLSLMAGQSDRQQLAAVASLRHRLNLRLSLPEESGRFSHEHVVAWKGLAFAAERSRRLFARAETGADTRQLARGLLDAKRALAQASSRPGAFSRRRLEELEGAVEERETRLAELSQEFRASLRPPSSEGLRRLLPPGVVLIDYLAYDGAAPSRPFRRQKWQRRLSAWVVRADAPTVRVDLGVMTDIEEDITAWRKAIESARDEGKLSARLRAAVWAPLEKHLAGAKVVLISPDGALGRLPFAALPGRAPSRYLLEEAPLAVLPIPRELARLKGRPRGKPSLLAMGDVAYGEGSGGWAELPGTRTEAKTTVARFRGLVRGEAALLTGEKASRGQLREMLPKYRYAHLATHGFFASPKMLSALERRENDPYGVFRRGDVPGWSPGLLSGLVLAGANSPTARDDGVLTALEIAEMDLSGMELAVLSACQTGLGKEAAGEGMLGLQRAFAVAGCRSVVSSLWSVDDAATAVLMERFYLHLWQKKLSKIEALRQAQLDAMRHPEWVEEKAKKMRGTGGLRAAGKASERIVGGKKQRRSPPAWWAAWQLSGDWR
jgi:CHAT domain-containing protein/Flp pilus assembly protein TadD